MGLTRKAVNQTERRERDGLGIRSETSTRYLAALDAIIARQATAKVGEARDLITAGLLRLEEIEA